MKLRQYLMIRYLTSSRTISSWPSSLSWNPLHCALFLSPVSRFITPPTLTLDSSLRADGSRIGNLPSFSLIVTPRVDFSSLDGYNGFDLNSPTQSFLGFRASHPPPQHLMELMIHAYIHAHHWNRCQVSPMKGCMTTR
eukprot:TRINITY_DN2001_c0_g2_i3.p2 TRINITY_DN2001_c0_g2~~TRINITY_DN2001_c0_g2_i3.p2  ORF type:complete len:138 (-),score=5.77 TRINITY_DN2001_c0_g2_i3:622-1035(-)